MNENAGTLRLARDVAFCGPTHGARRDPALGNASALVLSSVSEGLPMAMLEAWASGLPVDMTAACNLPEGFEAGAAQQIGAEPADKVPSLVAFLGKCEDELYAIGARGRHLIAEPYSWSRMAEDFVGVYQAMLAQQSSEESKGNGNDL